MKFETVTGQEQGPRDYQEDRFFAGDSVIAVVDGMGGHADGDVAAQTAIDVVAEHVQEHGAPQGVTDVEHIIIKAGRAVLGLPGGNQYRAPGAVIVLAALVGSELLVGWAGDSRAYVNGELVTEDHANTWGGITNCLGAGMLPNPEVIVMNVATGDRVVVASDGFNQIPVEAFGENPDALMDRARQRGLYDNTTFVAGTIV